MCLLAVAVATNIAALEITCDTVIAATGLGATASAMVSRISDPSNSVAPLASGDLERLRRAAVPEEVIRALMARSTLPTPTSPLRPDDGRLEGIVRMYRQGLSQGVIEQQVCAAGETYKLTANDMVFLKQQGISEAIISALLSAGRPAPTPTPPPPSAPALTPLPVPTAGPAAVAPADVVVDGVLLMQATHLGKNRPGSLHLAGEQVAWQDEVDAVRGFVVRSGEIAQAWLRCRTVGDGKFCYEFGVETVKKERLRFQDARVGQAANEAVLRIEKAFRVRFPRLELGEQLDP
jgi:hypothetical protein